MLHCGVLRVVPALAAALLAVVALAPPARADSVRDAQWHLKSLRVGDAHKISRGNGVVVAVIDSGVSNTHPDLKGAVLAGRDVLENVDNGTRDLGGHGTSMAGIIAARGRSGGRGLLGIAPESKILPICPTGDSTFVIESIDWAVSRGAKVINMSFAVPATPNLEVAAERALAANVVLVGSAGNTGDGKNEVEYPAAYPAVLAVGSTDRQGRVAPFSQRGPQVDIVAPGVDIKKLALPDGYDVAYGTSDSAAIVSGAAALVRAKFPNLTATQVVDRLISTAKDRGPKGRDDAYGHGELDIMAALTAKLPPSLPTTSPTPSAAEPPVIATPPTRRDPSGIPPMVIIGAGLLLLLFAAVAGALLLRRSRRQ